MSDVEKRVVSYDRISALKQNAAVALVADYVVFESYLRRGRTICNYKVGGYRLRKFIRFYNDVFVFFARNNPFYFYAVYKFEIRFIKVYRIAFGNAVHIVKFV